MPHRARLLVAALVTSVLAVMHPGNALARTKDCAAEFSASVSASRIDALARGFNLNGWLDTDEGIAPDVLALAELRARGFTHVRLPIQPARFMKPFSDQAEIARNFSELDAALDQLQKLGFAVSIDLHPGKRLGRVFDAAPDAGLQLVKGLWRKIARRYAGRSPDTLYFEVLNEPSVAAADWERMGPKIVKAIRAEAPDHTIVYALTPLQRLDEMTRQRPLDEPNVVYAAHYYDPMVFTHQGRDWGDGPLRDLHGVPFPLHADDPDVVALQQQLRRDGHDEAAETLTDALNSPWDDGRIDHAIAGAAQWARQNRVPVIINEFGALSWAAPRADRLYWYGAVSRLAETHCFGWALWDYAQGFGFVQRDHGREIPDEDMLVALFGDLSGRPKQDVHP